MRNGYTSAVIAALLMLAVAHVDAQTPDPLDAPPPNLAPASVHLSAILAQHDAAVGRPAGTDSVIEDWRFTDSGVSGTLHLERSGTQQAQIQVLPAAAFNGDDPVPGAIAYPLDFDDGFPFISVGMDDVPVDDTLLAIEFTRTVLFEDLFSAHPELVAGQGAKESTDLPFADNGQFGRTIYNWVAKPATVSFGNVNFQQPAVLASNEPLYLSNDRAVDALLGFDFLRFFDVYLDYPHGRILVKPNALLLRIVHAHA